MKMVSFIIPAFNAADTIEACLTAIKNQEHLHPYEVIVVDNNSTDETFKIADSISGIKVVLETRQGRSHARNLGIKISSGDFLAFVDADVVLDRAWITHMLKHFNNHGGAHGPVIPDDCDEQKNLNSYRKRSAKQSTLNTFNLLTLAVKESPMINTAACLYHRRAIESVFGFDENLIRHEDIDLSRRVLMEGFSLLVVPEAKAYVSYNGSGWISYFKRSYEDGYTKSYFLKKWKNYLFVSQTYKNESNFQMFKDEVISNLLKSFLKNDSYYLKKALNSLCKTFGRLAACFDRRTVNVYDRKPKNKSGFVFQDNHIIIEFDFINKTVVKK